MVNSCRTETEAVAAVGWLVVDTLGGTDEHSKTAEGPAAKYTAGRVRNCVSFRHIRGRCLRIRRIEMVMIVAPLEGIRITTCFRIRRTDQEFVKCCCTGRRASRHGSNAEGSTFTR